MKSHTIRRCLVLAAVLDDVLDGVVEAETHVQRQPLSHLQKYEKYISSYTYKLIYDNELYLVFSVHKLAHSPPQVIVVGSVLFVNQFGK